MNADLQNIIALLVVLSAGVYVARAAWGTVMRRKAPACGSGCGTCPANSATTPGEMVGLDQLVESARSGRVSESS